MPVHTRLSVAECLKRAQECRDFARRAKAAEHIVALESMAEVWERIAADVKQNQSDLLRLPLSKSRVMH
jgi:hypothetical protein